MQLYVNFTILCNFLWLLECSRFKFSFGQSPMKHISPCCAIVFDFWNRPDSSSILFCAWIVNVFLLGSLFTMNFTKLCNCLLLLEWTRFQFNPVLCMKSEKWISPSCLWISSYCAIVNEFQHVVQLYLWSIVEVLF